MRRRAPFFAALFLILSPLCASAVSALFDFDDFPIYTGDSSSPDYDQPVTFLYGCNGKDHCTGKEVLGTNNDGDTAASTVSTTRNGIFMELSRDNFDIKNDSDGRVGTGNGPEEFNLFLFDFDTPLRSFSAEITRPRVIDQICDDDDVCTDVYTLVKLYLWSAPGGQGALVGSLTLTPDDVLGNLVTVALITDQPFLSANFGQSVSVDPDCIATQSPRCGSPNGHGWGADYVFDDILVSTVPEPSPAALLILGLVGVAAARRARPIV